MKRQSGIDLVRITGLFFVVGVHQFLYNRFYYEPQIGIHMWAADVFRWLFFCCNGIFMMLTGYLRCGKTGFRDCYRGLGGILLSYTLCCFIIYPIQYVLGDKTSILTCIHEYLTFGNYAWYVEMYIGLILFSPVINLGLKHMTDRELTVFAGIMFFVTSVHYISPLNLIPDYWSSLYPVTYYLLGALIRRRQPRVKPWQGLGLALLVSMLLAVFSIISTDEGFSKGFTQGYGGFWTMLTAAGVFLGLYRIHPGERISGVLAFLAGGVFEGYLLSKVFDIWTYPLFKQLHRPGQFWKLFLVVTVPTFICTLLLGKLVNCLSTWLIGVFRKSHRENMRNSAKGQTIDK